QHAVAGARPCGAVLVPAAGHVGEGRRRGELGDVDALPGQVEHDRLGGAAGIAPGIVDRRVGGVPGPGGRRLPGAPVGGLVQPGEVEGVDTAAVHAAGVVIEITGPVGGGVG